MSTYVGHHDHDPRSLWSQRNRTGQLLGAPIVHDHAVGGPTTSSQRRFARSNWANGTQPRRR